MATEIMQQLPQLEAMCMQLYNAQNPQDRAVAEQSLRVFALSTDYIPHCKMILDVSTSPYAQLMAISSLLKIVSEHALISQIKLDMHAYFLGFLESKGPGLEGFVLNALIQLICRMSKLCWSEDETYRGIVTDAGALMDRGVKDGWDVRALLGLRLLNAAVLEFNSPTPRLTLTQHRKTAVAFRDAALFGAFQRALGALRTLPTAGRPPAEARALADQVLRLALGCLSFDFVGTCLDESAEDLGTIQIPSAWRSAVEDPATVQLFWDYYGAHEPPLSCTALECLVRLASVRRSLFGSDSARSVFLSRLVDGSREVLVSRRGLSHQQNYHEFCKLLGRLKTNYQLSELVSLPMYSDWISRVAEFTVSSLASWQWSADSVCYLLSLWARLVSSLPYLKGDAPSHLASFVPRVAQAYISSRLDAAAADADDDQDDFDSSGAAPETEEQVQEQLESLPYLFRFQYEDVARAVTEVMDPLMSAYGNALGQAASNVARRQLRVLEGQLAWLVYIIGAVLKGRGGSSGTTEAQEAIDGDLAARVFLLLRTLDQSDSLPQSGRVFTSSGGSTGTATPTALSGGTYPSPGHLTPSRRRLEMAALSFLQAFRKVFIGEAAAQSTKVYARLGERAALPDHAAVVRAALSKITTNLRLRGTAEDVTGATLDLLKDLATGYMSARLLLKLDALDALAAAQLQPSSGFFSVPAPANVSPRAMRFRTTFYATLARLLFMEETNARFAAFVAPLDAQLQELGSRGAAMRENSIAALRSSFDPVAVAALFRDLRGIASATNTRRTYSLLFDWLYPRHFPAILACLEAWVDTPMVTTPLLKFINEFALNKSQRLVFDTSSPNGILLFRELSKVIVVYGTGILASLEGKRENHPSTTSTDKSSLSVYDRQYKGSWICLSILSRALSGNYVNFGVFELYGDPALKDALGVAVRLALAIPLDDILAYRKLAKAYFALVDALCAGHASLLASCDSRTFAFLVSSLETGINSLDVAVSSQCAAAIDSLAGYYFQHSPASGGSPTPGSLAIAEHVKARPELFASLLTTLMELVLFEDCTNMWSLTRPVLPLILVNEQVYGQIRTQMVAKQPPEAQPHLAAVFDKLMVDVQRSLDPRNRDKFTQNFTLAHHEFRSKI